MNIKLHTLFTLSLVFFTTLITPTEALAVIQNLNGQTGQNQTFANDPNVSISSSGNVHSLGWLGLLPVSRGGTGAGSFSAGSLLFSNGTSISQDNTNLFWDDTNNRLGIGTSSPAKALDVTGDAIINSVTIGRGTRGLVTNTALGNSALNSISASNNNTAVGFTALGSGLNNGEQNTAVGSEALSSDTTGSQNSAIGHRALWQITSGNKNIALGAEALQNTTTSENNIGIGFRSLSANTVGGSNIAIGTNALDRNLTGASNIAIGPNAAVHQADGITELISANGGIYIGNSVRGNNNNDSNSIVIGDSAVGAGTNKAVIGNFQMTDIYLGSTSGNASAHAKALYLGSSSVPGCIIMGDTAGGVGYVTLDSGVLTVSTTKPSACP